MTKLIPMQFSFTSASSLTDDVWTKFVQLFPHQMKLLFISQRLDMFCFCLIKHFYMLHYRP